MRFRTLVGAAVGAAALATALSAPAFATERAWDACGWRPDYTIVFNPDGRFCFQALSGPDDLAVNIDRVSTLHAGVNSGWVEYFDGRTGAFTRKNFVHDDEFSINNGVVTKIHLNR
ncbi:hypothetical protein F0L68_40170 [Solihabitans fulvus]|uniref:Beta/Gamma crystallin n=1 Tax=Solihabitans fulvus TaxID=1892852 RepID=A0A5B2WAS4_9PSEU|nr:hypothetical protein [Solihabitans fulvus]KAA2247299.1 hypothetical protein F0L68_40170 [Solihabitans fulvus]